MKALNRGLRTLYISYVLFKYGLDDILLGTGFFRPLRFLSYLSPSRFNGAYRKPRGQRIRQALEELGPLFVKFGQILSTRIDLLPADITQELALLQDKVPPFSSVKAQQMIEKALNAPLKELFQKFDEIPLASASIAQVHAATLWDGTAVVVKVLRPHIEKQVHRDIALLKRLATLSDRYWRRTRQFKPKDIVAEFEKTLLAELDLSREAANASHLRRNFQESRLLYVPEVHWPLTRKNVLVMEKIKGIPIYDINTLKKEGFNLKQIAELNLELFFTQVFRDCFFHADLHPGNIFLCHDKINHPQFIMVDFGIVGSLSTQDQRYLAENFLALIHRDYRRVAELHRASAWIPATVRIDEFEAQIRTVCEPIFEKPLKEISFGTLVFQLFQTATRFKIQIQPQLILLQKTLLSVESLSRQLYPELDLWRTVKPLLENWQGHQMSPKTILKKLKSYGPLWMEKLPELPSLMLSALENMANLPITLKSHEQIEIEKEKESQTKNSQKTIWFGMLLGALITCTIFWMKGF